jgi:predicted metal-dependent hydrolase
VEPAIDGLNYSVAFRDVKFPRLEFKTGDLLVVLPNRCGGEAELLEKHAGWLNEKRGEIKSALREARNEKLDLKRSEEKLEETVYSIAKELSREFGFGFKKIFFRRMSSKWGSHSAQGNLTLNTSLKFLPKRLIEYVVFHEAAHFVEKKHDKRFWRLISKKFGDYRRMERKLLVYWFLIQKSAKSN